MEPREFLNSLWRYRLWCVLVFALTVATATLLVKGMTPMYEATAEILIVQSDPNLRNLFQERNEDDTTTFARDSNPINTQAELLKVTPLLESTIAEAGLRSRKTGEPLGVQEFKTTLKITPLKGTDLIRVAYQHSDPEMAARVVDVLCRRFARLNVEDNRQEATETLTFLDRQAIGVKAELELNDRALEHFKTRHHVYDLKSELEYVTQNLNHIEGQARENQLAVREQQGRVKLLSEKLGIPPDQALGDLAIAIHPTIQKLRGQLVEAYTNPLLTSGVGTELPEVKTLRGHIRQLEEAIRDEATIAAGRSMEKIPQVSMDPVRERLARDLVDQQIAVIAGEVRQDALRAQLSAYRGRIHGLPKVEQTLAKLSRDRELNIQLYQLLLKRREQARIAQAMNIGNVRVVQTAEIPKEPVKPNVKQSIAGAGLLGLVLAAFVAIGLDYFDDTLRHEARTREALGEVPITGRIPERRMDVRLGARGADPLLNASTVGPALTDTYGLLRLDIARALGPQFKLLLAGAGEPEVAYYAANVALSFAQSGRRVLLIDGDLRTPALHGLFQLTQASGMSELLNGEAGWEDVAAKVPNLPLWIIPAVAAESHPLDLLDSPRLWALKQTIVNFDVVLGVAPQITKVPDAVALSNLFDNFWLVVHHRHDERGELKKAVNLLHERRLTVNGALFIRKA